MADEEAGWPEPVKTYFREVRSYLGNVDEKTRETVLSDLRDILSSKLNVLEEEGKAQDRDALLQTLDQVGKPATVVSNYLEFMPSRPSRRIQVFVVFQGLVAVISILLAIQLLYYYPPDLSSLRGFGAVFLALAIMALSWILLGFMLLYMAVQQLRAPDNMIEFGSFSAVLSMILSSGLIILGFVDSLSDRFGMLDITSIALVWPPIIALLLVHFWGLRMVNRFQSTIIRRIPKEKIFRKWRKSSVLTTVFTVSVVSLMICSFGLLAYYAAYSAANVGKEDFHLVYSQPVGGPYNATVEFWSGYHTDADGTSYDAMNKIVYEIGGQKVEGDFTSSLVGSLDWIKNNTPPDATIIAWWDYGHSIRGYTGRNVVAVNPSKSIYPNTLWRPERFKVFDSDEKIRDISNVLIGTNEIDIRGIMTKYNATYILTRTEDLGISYAIFQGAGKNLQDYNIEHTFWPNEKGKTTFLYSTWYDGGFGSAKLLYQDLDTRIYAF